VFWPSRVSIRGKTAVVEFPTEQHQKSFLAHYPGSVDGGIGPTFNVRGVDLTIEAPPRQYSRAPPPSNTVTRRVRNSHGKSRASFVFFTTTTAGRSDWYCPLCGGTNFARRIKCFQCGETKPDDARTYDSSSEQNMAGRQQQLTGAAPEEAVPVGLFDSKEPTATLVLYQLSKFSGEAEVATAVRAYAPAKEVRLLRDGHGKARGVAFVTFFNVDAAAHTLATASKNLTIDGERVVLAYSNGVAILPPSSRAAASRPPPPKQQQRHHQRPSPDVIKRHSRSTLRRGGRPPSESSGEEDHYRPSTSTSANPKRREWPPPFDKDGASYTFDASSGYFYEPSSGFYYDPKLKVYYNAHTRAYYHHTPSTTPPFTKFENEQQRGQDHTPNDATATTTTTSQKEDDVKTKPAEIISSIKRDGPTKQDLAGPITFGLSARQQPQATAAQPAAKKIAPAFALSHVLAVGTDYAQLHRLKLDDLPVVRQCQRTGKWMCLISKRQFPTESQLQKHVAKSALYRDALEKAASGTQQGPKLTLN